MDLSTRYFVWLIIQVSFAFLANEFMWFLDGKPALAFAIANLFRTVGFGIDENGFYYSTSMNWTGSAYMGIVALTTVLLLIRSNATLIEKSAGFSFLTIPVSGAYA